MTPTQLADAVAEVARFAADENFSNSAVGITARDVDWPAIVDALRLLEKLPRTADGKVIELGMTLWIPLDLGCYSIVAKGLRLGADGKAWVKYQEHLYDGSFYYADREAAEAFAVKRAAAASAAAHNKGTT